MLLDSFRYDILGLQSSWNIGSMKELKSRTSNTPTTACTGMSRLCHTRAMSAPAGKITLDRFPMNVDRIQARKSARNQRTMQLRAWEDVQKAEVDSKNLRQYGKSVFDFAVGLQQSQPVQIYKPNRAVSCPSLPKTGPWMDDRPRKARSHRHIGSGPTSSGSPLYNQKASMLNSIRIRPSSQPAGKYNHEKSTISPYLQTTINQCALELRIANVNTSTQPDDPNFNQDNSSLNSFDEVIILPVENSTRYGDFSACWSRESVKRDSDRVATPPKPLFRRPSVPVLVQIDITDSSDTGSLEKIPEDESVRSSVREQKDSVKKVTLKPGNAQGQKKNAKNGGGGKQATDSLRPVSPNARPNSANRGRAKSKRAGSVSGRRQSPSAEKGSKHAKDIEEPVKLALPGPHCWVDDITVSSLSSPEAEGGSEAPDNNTEVDASVDMLGSVKSSSKTMGRPLEEEIPSPHLPGFLCPSSELKSRHVAIKHWLRDTTFHCANRSVPLL